MMVSGTTVTVTVTGDFPSLEAVEKYITLTEDRIKMGVDKLGSQVGETIRRNVRAQAPSASGKMKSTIGPPQYIGKGKFKISVGAGLYRDYAYEIIMGGYPKKFIPINWIHQRGGYGGIDGWAIRYPERIPKDQFRGWAEIRPKAPNDFVASGVQYAAPELDTLIRTELEENIR